MQQENITAEMLTRNFNLSKVQKHDASLDERDYGYIKPNILAFLIYLLKSYFQVNI